MVNGAYDFHSLYLLIIAWVLMLYNLMTTGKYETGQVLENIFNDNLIKCGYNRKISTEDFFNSEIID